MTTDAFRSHAARAEINVTPLIDVLLALVVIMIVAAPMALHRLPLPGDSHRQTAPPRTLALSILSTGELYLGGISMSRAQLARTLSAEALVMPPPSLEIRSDADTPYEKVADALALAHGSGLGAISILDARAQP
ncbi:ExbD/TolR family protein [Dokdonella sp.]|uniref:ExbD/TolR family protein n=1 Tax=Dokdonella sp. TaxID=2291710 RepID=UPI0037830318